MTGMLAPSEAKLNSSAKSHTIVDSGYDANVFAGKKEQMVQVGEYLENSGFLPKELVQNEVSWFYGYVFESGNKSAHGLIGCYHAAIWALMTFTLLWNLSRRLQTTSWLSTALKYWRSPRMRMSWTSTWKRNPRTRLFTFTLLNLACLNSKALNAKESKSRAYVHQNHGGAHDMPD